MTPRAHTNLLLVLSTRTPPSMDIGKREVERWDRQRGLFAIGCHYVIRRDGTLEQGRHREAIGAAGPRQQRPVAVSIKLVGGVLEDDPTQPEDNFTEAQVATVGKLLAALSLDYPGAVTEFDMS